jgi:hypothetical protein
MSPSPSIGNANPIILELITYNREYFEKHDNLSVEDLLLHRKNGQVNWVNLFTRC